MKQFNALEMSLVCPQSLVLAVEIVNNSAGSNSKICLSSGRVELQMRQLTTLLACNHYMNWLDSKNLKKNLPNHNTSSSSSIPTFSSIHSQNPRY
ncbi:hypothetical protein EPI10_002296 [Gossypium australe]|uniref:Uncharacterized protein n=1 Tax=Gossypium australe TaxID=47621 RepID=A0A5B6VDY5_9ROSI|nr:hypothetical protein EPI10_002296 [Gossypium australe]